MSRNRQSQVSYRRDRRTDRQTDGRTAFQLYIYRCILQVTSNYWITWPWISWGILLCCRTTLYTPAENIIETLVTISKK